MAILNHRRLDMTYHEDIQSEQIINFRDDPYRQFAMRAKGFLGTYLIALAAYQRGLQVTFLYDTEKVKSSDKISTEVQVGRNFALSDGKSVYRFSSSSGPFTSNFAKNVTQRKDTQKILYQKVGIPVPVGFLSSKTDLDRHLSEIEEQSGASKFVIKPYNGSLARDTYVNLTRDEASSIGRDFPYEELMLEEFVSGPEYRFTVVNGKCVGVFERRAPHVVGDGVQTVEQLVEEKNSERMRNPFLVGKYISILHMNAEDKNAVVELGQQFQLSDLQRVGAGGDPWDVTDVMPQVYKDIAVKATSVIQSGSAGVDIIIGDLADPASARVLEANVRHHIEGHSFCVNKEVWDNRVAEAIVEMYFPEARFRQTAHLAIFDHRNVCRALQTQSFAALHLPRIEEDWLAWNFFFGKTDVHKQIRKYIVPILGSYGLNCNEVQINRDRSCLNIVGPAVSYEGFLKETNLVEALRLADEIGSIGAL